ncbi:MAG: hypothetical protein K0R26_931 [Bacteroidota bacterium]|jgi:hypothetical protein|nr:hypothetical protein [Bacteroidota bacterium]
MTKSIIRSILPIILTGQSFLSFAQISVDDSQVWTHLRLKKEITNKLDVNLKVQARLKNDVSSLGRASANFRINYKLHKNVKLMAGYSFIEKQNKKEIFKTRHSYYAAIELKKSIRRFEVSYRNLFMLRYKNPLTSYEGYIPYFYDRNRVTIRYEQSKRVSLYLKEDINIPLNNPQLSGISRARTFLGTEISITKNQQLDLYLMYHYQFQDGDWFEQDISYTPTPLDRFIVYGIGYEIKF